MTLTALSTAVAAVGAGILGGIFFIFSAAIVPALDRRPAAEAVAVMREINKVIVGPAFLLVFLGTAAVAVVAVVLEPGDLLADLGAALYVLGAIVLTAAVNIPLNNALEVATGDADQIWRAFRGRWLVSNHIRTAASVAASALLTAAV